MTDLVQRLEELGARLEYPPTPELAPAVLSRLDRPRRRRGRRLLAVALALLALAAAVLAVSPGARSQVRDWLGIGGVRIVEVDELPFAPLRGQPFLGNPLSIAEARRSVDFPILLPRGDTPDAVYLRDDPPGGLVTLVYGSPTRPRLLVTQWQGRTYEPVLLKSVTSATKHEDVTVGGGRGLWLSGAPHAVVSLGRNGEQFEESLALAGNVLVWEDGDRSFRLEADIDRDDAVRLAESLRP